ncbi:MAG: outer membrane lipoprotein chaperone LolA [Succinivibrio sp.]
MAASIIRKAWDLAAAGAGRARRLSRAAKAALAAAAAFAALSGAIARADDSASLKDRIFAFDELSATFSATTQKAGGGTQSSSGTIALRRPGSLVMHTLKPDELLLFTRGDEVCYYDPFVNQLTIFSKSQSYSSPFMLLATRDEKAWGEYDVKRSGDTWTLAAKHPRDVLSMEIGFDGSAIRFLKLRLKDGSTSSYELGSIRNSVDDGAFDVKIPSDAEIDDERGAD